MMFGERVALKDLGLLLERHPRFMRYWFEQATERTGYGQDQPAMEFTFSINQVLNLKVNTYSTFLQLLRLFMSTQKITSGWAQTRDCTTLIARMTL